MAMVRNKLPHETATITANRRRASRALIAAHYLAVLLVAGCGSDSGTENDLSPLTDFVFVDLQPRANKKLAGSGLPTGAQTLGGAQFQVGESLLQVGGRSHANYPTEIAGVAVNGMCRQIHFLQATEGGSYQQPGHLQHEHDGTLVGRYVVYYADGIRAEVPIVYGEDLRDWWNWDGSKPATRAQIVWNGENASASRNNVTLRLYLNTWQNPYPDKVIQSLDLVSARAKASPFCVAISLGDARTVVPAPTLAEPIVAAPQPRPTPTEKVASLPRDVPKLPRIRIGNAFANRPRALADSAEHQHYGPSEVGGNFVCPGRIAVGGVLHHGRQRSFLHLEYC